MGQVKRKLPPLLLGSVLMIKEGAMGAKLCELFASRKFWLNRATHLTSTFGTNIFLSYSNNHWKKGVNFLSIYFVIDHKNFKPDKT